MKKLCSFLIMILALSANPVLAHHAAEGIVDEEIYEMIDSLVADTPHADMTLDDIAIGMTEMTVTTNTLVAMENMLDDGLLTYISMLDGEVDVSIIFNDDRSVTLTVTQNEIP